jgi:hypothetical protein
MSVETLRAQIDEVGELPYGRSRTAAAESLVGRAEGTGDERLLVEARMELARSYAWGDEPLKKFGPFAWLLGRWDAEPELFSGHLAHQFLWLFKSVATGGLNHPGISLAQIEGVLGDMQQRYERAGAGPAPWLGCRYQVDAHVHGEQAARESFLAWTRAPRTELSDCQACEPTTRVGHLAALGRHEDAVRESLPALQSATCIEQPQSMIAAVLPSLLLTGHGERAAGEHVRAVRLMRGRVGETGMWGKHILVLARAGRLRRGLDLLEEHLHELDDPPDLWAQLTLAAAGARLLRELDAAGLGGLAVSARGPRPATWTVPDLERHLSGLATGLAERFDQRNGSSTASGRVRDWLEGPALPDLPLDVVPTRARDEVPAPRPAALPPRPADLGAIGAAYAAAVDSGSAVDRLAVVDAWRQARDTVPADADPALVALLDVLLLTGPDDGDEAALSAALDRLEATGQGPRALVHRIFRLAGSDDVTGTLAALRPLLERARQEPPADHGEAAYVAFGLLLGLPHDDERVEPLAAELFGEAVTALESVPVAALSAKQRAALARLRAHGAEGLPDQERTGALEAAYALLPAGERAGERTVIGMRLAMQAASLGDLGRASALLPGLLSDAATAGDDRLQADVLELAGRIALDTERPDLALERLGQAVARIGDENPLRRADLQQQLVMLLLDGGRFAEAAELADEAVASLSGALESAGIDPDKPLAPGQEEAASVAGTLLHHAARAAQALDEDEHALRLALRGAAWHRLTGWDAARAETLSLAAASQPDPAGTVALLTEAAQLYEATDHPVQAAGCRRRLAAGIHELSGLEAARDALATAEQRLVTVLADEPPGPRQEALRWQQVSLREQRARVLAEAEEYAEALAATDGLEQAYREIGDEWNARDAVGLRVWLLDEAGRAGPGELDRLEEAAAAALADDDPDHARQLGGLLARIADQHGDPERAEAVWSRFS